MKRKYVSLKLLKQLNACKKSLPLFEKHFGHNRVKLEDVIKKAIEINRPNYANWLIVRCMNREECVSYAMYVAEQVLDNRPRKAIAVANAYTAADTVADAVATYAAYTSTGKKMMLKILRYGLELIKKRGVK